jgi:4-hydroxythreonine-4-phosphate dehydrogenase
VAGLNPHAGEGGLFGREEIEVIAPAVAAARPRASTRTARSRPTPSSCGPARGEFDVVVAMYHDQG